MNMPPGLRQAAVPSMIRNVQEISRRSNPPMRSWRRRTSDSAHSGEAAGVNAEPAAPIRPEGLESAATSTSANLGAAVETLQPRISHLEYC